MGEGKAKSDIFSMRLDPEMRARLEAADIAGAAQSGRAPSLSREIISRLRASFHLDDDIEKHFGSKRFYALMRVITHAVGASLLVSGHRAKDTTGAWLDDPRAFAVAVAAFNATLKAARPKNIDAEKISAEQKAKINQIAQGAAWHVLQQVYDAKPTVSTSSHGKYLASRYKRELGEIAERARHKIEGARSKHKSKMGAKK
jgi:hypothetical protein